MKFEDLANGRQRQIIPETPVEQMAVDYARQHLPIFASVEMTVINAFIAGYDRARELEAEFRRKTRTPRIESH